MGVFDLYFPFNTVKCDLSLAFCQAEKLVCKGKRAFQVQFWIWKGRRQSVQTTFFRIGIFLRTTVPKKAIPNEHKKTTGMLIIAKIIPVRVNIL